MAYPLAPMRALHIGDVRVTYIPDGGGSLTTGTFLTAPEDCWVRHSEWLAREGRWAVSIGGFLVESGDSKVLVDLGFGKVSLEIPDFATVETGSMIDNLAIAGLAPGDIDTVVYTHLHSDHTGWTISDGALTFPNARHLAGPGELAHWNAHPEENFATPEDVRQSLDSHLEESADGHQVAPGVTIKAAYGHTPGHQCVVISSGTERAVILGDIVHCAAQIAEDEMTIIFDVDAALARTVRDEMLDSLAGTDTVAGCHHFSRSAFGRVLLGQGRRYWGPID